MKYKEYLNEMKNLDFISKIDSIDDVKKLLQTHCKKMNFDYPLWRGMRNSGDFAILDGAKVERNSKDGNNLHTLMFGETFKGTKLPVRTKSIISIGFDGHIVADGYGAENYLIFPYDDVVLGTIPNIDILWAENEEYEIELDAINRAVAKVFGFDSFKKIASVEELKEKLDNYKEFDFDSVNYQRANSHMYKIIQKDIESLKNVNGKSLFDMIKQYYNPKDFKMETDTQRQDSLMKSDNEIWFSGKCIAIKESEWEEMKKGGFKLK